MPQPVHPTGRLDEPQRAWQPAGSSRPSRASQPPQCLCLDGRDASGGSGGGARSIALDGESWVVEIENEVKTLDSSEEERLWNKPSIYRLPPSTRDLLNPKAITPQVASFGPFHHGEVHLQPMEEHKRRALVHFLKRAGRSVDDYVVAIDGAVEQLQDSYQPLDEEWRRDRDRFRRLMIVDGCFMLEVLRLNPTAPTIVRDYAPNDPIFSKHGMLHIMPYIRRDMLMIENQLPLLILKILLAVERGGEAGPDADCHINNLVLKFCTNVKEECRAGALGLHVLDVFRRNMIKQVPSSRRAPPPPTQGFSGVTLCSAVELSEAGVHFRKSGSSSLRDISFKGGVLTLPPIEMDDATECTLVNLVAFEHLHVGAGNEVTSYVAFMNEIIDTAKDVSLLHTKGVIQNAMGSDKAAAELFNTIDKELTPDPGGDLGMVRHAVNGYYSNRYNKWCANLRHTYFRNPWSLISVVAAAFVIVLTLSQTVYSILQYYESPPPPSPH